MPKMAISSLNTRSSNTKQLYHLEQHLSTFVKNFAATAIKDDHCENNHHDIYPFKQLERVIDVIHLRYQTMTKEYLTSLAIHKAVNHPCIRRFPSRK